jgi:PAS domain S-box-containing protein
MATKPTYEELEQRNKELEEQSIRHDRIERALRDSEERFKELADLLPQGVYEVDMEGTLTYANRRALELFGYLKEDLEKGLNVIDMLIPEDRERAAAAMGKVMMGTSSGREYEYEALKKEGGSFTASIYSSPIIRQGKTVGMRGIIVDITGRKRTEEALRREHDLVSRIMDTSPVGIAMVNRAGEIAFANDELGRVLGLTKDEITGRTHNASDWHITDFDGNPFPDEQLPFRQVMATGRPVRDVRHAIDWPDGRRVLLSINAAPLLDTAGRVDGVVASISDVTDRVKTETELAEQKSFFEQMFLQSPTSTQILDKDGWCLRINPKLSQLFGVAPENIEGHLYNIFADEGIKQGGVIPHLEKVFNEGKTAEWEVHFDIGIAADSQNIQVSEKKKAWFWTKAYPIFDANGQIKYVIVQHEDITERKRAEAEREKLQAQLSQAQKMESVGRLAGGVAHDFNNKLGVIIGNVEMAMMDLEPEDPKRHELQEIMKAAQHSAALVRQLLGFARKQTVSPMVLDLNHTVSGMLKMLRRLIGEDIDLAWMPDHDLWQVKIDPTQIDQILANLAVNARDAISGVGKVTIETENVTLDEAYCAVHTGFFPGQYVLLAVSDDGSGMSREVFEHLFEPFFTTKEVGKGTGLGLSTIYGIVKQNDGFINVYTEPGKGTAVKIYLPRFEAEGIAITEENKPQMRKGSAETVLLVEDEVSILKVGRAMLERLGYTVLAAGKPSEAIRLAGEHAGAIHLVLTDVVMPEMNGKELVEQLKLKHPGLKCLYMSGYTANVIAHHGILEKGVSMIQKPFSLKDLATKVRDALDEGCG